MPDWRCPACGGGFPDYVMDPNATGFGAPGDQCPWCGARLGEYDPTDPMWSPSGADWPEDADDE